MPDAGWRMADGGCRMEDAGCRMPDVGLTPILNILHPASGILHATCSSSHPVSHVTTFIDFECLAASPGSEGKTRAAASHPVMLGALGCRADEGVFRQSILDARLHGARVARVGLTAESLGAAVATLLVQCPDGPIVSWSNFDAQVVAAATDLAAHVKHRFAARHSNATARIAMRARTLANAFYAKRNRRKRVHFSKVW